MNQHWPVKVKPAAATKATLRGYTDLAQNRVPESPLRGRTKSLGSTAGAFEHETNLHC